MIHKTFRSLCALMVCAFTAVSAYAQTGKVTVSGRVTDGEGEALVGAGITVASDPSIGVVTDMDGNYTIHIPEGDVSLVYAFIGMDSVTEAVAGRSVINVTLKESALTLDGVVVTALGIKKAERSVTYNVQKVDQTAFKVPEVNMVNSLAGKLAGVQINETAAGAGAETKVVMRGAKSIAGSNNALYVLDGIPLPSLSRTKPGEDWSLYNGANLSGDGISNFNSEDIAETSALVGPSAAALYGSKAANGILMLTSRTGEKGFSVSYANNTTFSNPFMLPQIQNTYGSGTGYFTSWGEKMTSPSTWDVKDFFQTGYNTRNSLSASFGGENSTTYVSASWTAAKGIIPNNNYDRKNITLHHTHDLFNNKVHFSVLAMYMNVHEQNQLAGGQYYNPLVSLYLMSPSDDLAKYQTYERYDSSRGFKTQYWSDADGAASFSMQNPFWIVNRNLTTNDKNRFILGGNITWDITEWVDVVVRARGDMNYTLSQMKNYASTNGLFAGKYGRFYYDNYQSSQLYADALLNFHHTFGDNLIQLNATLGASIERYKDIAVFTRGDLVKIANLFTQNNMDTSKGMWKETINDENQAVFGTVQVGFKNWLFLDLTARNDWNTAMTTADGVTTPIFYPSVGLSWIITDAFNIKSDILSFAKVRASYAEVGNAPMRYIGVPYYQVGSGGTAATSTWHVADGFRPERTNSWEVGADVRLFKGSLVLGATYYNSKTFNQVFTPEVPAGSGYSTIYINAGRVDNQGVELSANYTLTAGDFKWNTGLVYSMNRNKIVKMLDTTVDGVPFKSSQLSVGGLTGAKFWLTEGGQIGDLYVSKLKTDEHGYIYVSSAELGSKVIPAENKGTIETMLYAGNVNPSWTGSWRNNFSWKGLTFGFMINARVGGIGVSATEAVLDTYGRSLRTAEARDNGGALVNGARIPAKDYYQTIGGQGDGLIGSMYTYSMTNIRIGEASIGYDIPIVKWVPWIKALNVSVVGRNLAMLYCKAPFDPELVQGAGNYSMGIDYFMIPSTRNIGFSAKITF